MDEEILVVPRAELFWNGPFHGVASAGLSEYLQRVRRFGVFRRRGDVEHDASFKQIIPYMVVRRNGRYMLFRRTRAGSEKRLHDLYSVGVGGHIARDDVDGTADLIAAGLQRELTEELSLTGEWSAQLVGVLNDDTGAVGQVHFGLVHVVDVLSGEVAIRETDRLTGGLATPAEIQTVYAHMETWSQLVLEAGIVGP